MRKRLIDIDKTEREPIKSILSAFNFSEEAIVMANLRKRVAACDLERRGPSRDIGRHEPNLEEFDNQPLLTKV